MRYIKNILVTFLPYIYIILVCLMFVRPIISVYQQKDKFFSTGYHTQYTSFKAAYGSSQYVQKKNPGIIPDETFEAFAGGFFLKGGDPILIVHDHPPLGRYFISLSILLFDNANTVIVPFLALSLMGLFLISKLVIKNVIIALIPVAIFANEPLFLNKLSFTPLPEPIQLPFIIFALYFFIRGIGEKKCIKWFILTSIMLGFVISTRFFVTGATLFVSMLLYLLLSKYARKKILLFLVFLPLSLVVLVLSYTRTILNGASILHIFGIQKYIYYYHKAQLSLPFSFWDLLMFNRWHTWWGTMSIMSDPQWIIIWPISMILTLIYLLSGIFKKISISEPEKVLIIWVIAYSLFLSLGQVSTRYFPPILPFIYILAVSFLVRILKFKNKIKLA